MRKAAGAPRLFRQITKEYFQGADVVFANQSRQPKGHVPLVVISCGAVSRHAYPNYEVVDGVTVGNYLSRLSVTVDLFTHGSPIVDEETGKTVAYADSALEDMLGYADFLGSEYVTLWCHRNDLAVLMDGDVQSITGIVNDTTFEYRARLSVFVYFTQKTVDSAAAASERSILYPYGGEYTPEEPIIKTSTTGNYGSEEETSVQNAVVEKEFAPTSSGGGRPGVPAAITTPAVRYYDYLLRHCPLRGGG